MNNHGPDQRLLNDILAEEADAGFREALLNATLRRARRRRQFRQARRAAPFVAAVLAVLLLVWRFLPGPGLRPVSPDRPWVVSTAPFPAARLVQTTPLSLERVISSIPSVQVVVTSTSERSFQEIDDSALLGLVAPAPAAVVRFSPHSAELVFANPSDREALLRQ